MFDEDTLLTIVGRLDVKILLALLQVYYEEISEGRFAGGERDLELVRWLANYCADAHVDYNLGIFLGLRHHLIQVIHRASERI